MINESDLSPKQKANLDAIIEMLPDMLSDDELKDAKPARPSMHNRFVDRSNTPLDPLA